MNRTQEEISQRIEAIKDNDLFGFQVCDLISYLTYENAETYIKPEVTKEQWETEPEISPARRIVDYMPFAWEKANECRGFSAMRSLEHMKSWLWLDGKDLHWDGDYEYYGKAELVRICEEYGIDWKQYDNDEWRNNEHEEPLSAEEVLNE